MLEIQVKFITTKKNAASIKTLRDDCIKKASISENEQELTLHILSATMMTKELRNMIPPTGVLVLNEGTHQVKPSRPKKPAEQAATKIIRERIPQVVVPRGLILVVITPAMNEQWTNSRWRRTIT